MKKAFSVFCFFWHVLLFLVTLPFQLVMFLIIEVVNKLERSSLAYAFFEYIGVSEVRGSFKRMKHLFSKEK